VGRHQAVLGVLWLGAIGAKVEKNIPIEFYAAMCGWTLHRLGNVRVPRLQRGAGEGRGRAKPGPTCPIAPH
jgi:hypothetical protein